jgi:hypothetical protein
MQDLYNTRQYPQGGSFAPKDTSSLDLLSKSLNQFVDNDLRNSLARQKQQKEEERKTALQGVANDLSQVDKITTVVGRNSARTAAAGRIAAITGDYSGLYSAITRPEPVTPQKLLPVKNAQGGYELYPETAGPMPAGLTPTSETPNGDSFVPVERKYRKDGKDVKEVQYFKKNEFGSPNAKPVHTVISEEPVDADPYIKGTGLRKSQIQEKIQQLENKNNEYNVEIATQESGVKRNADGSIEIIDKDGNPKRYEAKDAQTYKDAIERQKLPSKSGMLNNLGQIIEYKKMMGDKYDAYQSQMDKLKKEVGGEPIVSPTGTRESKAAELLKSKGLDSSDKAVKLFLQQNSHFK